jgi:hypothetical protein
VTTTDDNRPRASVVCAAEFFWQWQFGDTQYLPLFFLATDLAKVGVPQNSIWLQNLAKKGSEFFYCSQLNYPKFAKSGEFAN